MSKPKTPTPPGSGAGAACPPGSTAPCPCPTKVVFKEEEDTATDKTDKYKYGWDDYNTNADAPWKSVEMGKDDIVKSDITPADLATRAEFASAETAKATVSPNKASSAKQDLTVNGVAEGETEVNATCNSSSLGKFKVVVYAKKTITVAVRLVHLKDKTKSKDIPDADIKERLRKVYKQAAVEIVVTRLPEMTVDFDKDGDGLLDMTGSWGNVEQKAIIDACKDTAYNRNIFIVDNPKYLAGFTLYGMMDFNQRYGFVHASNTTTPLKTLAHELGHGLGLFHPSDDAGNFPTGSDAPNLMTQGLGDEKWRLRKTQWETLRKSPLDPPD